MVERATARGHRGGPGVRGKLLVAVSAVAAMTILASAVSLRSHGRMEDQLLTVLDRDVPSISLALRLAEASGRYAAGGSELIGVRNNIQRQNVDIALRQQAVIMTGLMGDLRERGYGGGGVDAIAPLVESLDRDLAELNLLVERRIAADRDHRAVLTGIHEANDALSKALRNTGSDAGAARVAGAATALVGRLFEIANAGTPNRVALSGVAAMEALTELSAALTAPPNDVETPLLRTPFLTSGAELVTRLTDTRTAQLEIQHAIDTLRTRVGDTSSKLSTTVGRLVTWVENRAETVRGDAAREAEAARTSLTIIAILTFIGPVAFVWALIGRRIVAPLRQLAQAAQSMADGDMAVPVPRGARDEIGLMAEALEAFRDATVQLAERTRALADSEARARSILDASVFPILIVHAETARVLFLNRLAAALFGLPPDPAEPEAMAFPDPEVWPAVRDELWPDGRVANLELMARPVVVGADPFWALTSAVRMSYRDEPAVLISFNDITDRKRSERQLRQAHDEASAALESLRLAQQHLIQAEKMASLGQLVAGVAHEINTPLGIALTSASHLADETRRMTRLADAGGLRKTDFNTFMSGAGETTQLLLMNITRAADLVHSFKQVSADQTSDSRRVFPLKEYLDDVLLSLKPSWRKAGHTVTGTCPDHVQVDGYPGILSQVLANLLMNALTHAYDDGRSGTMSVTVTERGDDWLEMVVADDGKGIPVNLRSKVFDPFFTTKRAEGCTGLGLNIVYNLVTLNMGGRITLESAEGKGTRFVMVFPREAPHHAPQPA